MFVMVISCLFEFNVFVFHFQEILEKEQQIHELNGWLRTYMGYRNRIRLQTYLIDVITANGELECLLQWAFELDTLRAHFLSLQEH